MHKIVNINVCILFRKVIYICILFYFMTMRKVIAHLREDDLFHSIVYSNEHLKISQIYAKVKLLIISILKGPIIRIILNVL